MRILYNFLFGHNSNNIFNQTLNTNNTESIENISESKEKVNILSSPPPPPPPSSSSSSSSSLSSELVTTDITSTSSTTTTTNTTLLPTIDASTKILQSTINTKNINPITMRQPILLSSPLQLSSSSASSLSSLSSQPVQLQQEQPPQQQYQHTEELLQQLTPSILSPTKQAIIPQISTDEIISTVKNIPSSSTTTTTIDSSTSKNIQSKLAAFIFPQYHLNNMQKIKKDQTHMLPPSPLMIQQQAPPFNIIKTLSNTYLRTRFTNNDVSTTSTTTASTTKMILDTMMTTTTTAMAKNTHNNSTNINNLNTKTNFNTTSISNITNSILSSSSSSSLLTKNIHIPTSKTQMLSNILSSSTTTTTSPTNKLFTSPCIRSKSLMTPPIDNNDNIIHVWYKSTYFNEFIAGFLSSMIATIILQPLDSIKMNQIARKNGIISTIKTIYNTHGITQFYRALPINCMAYSITYGIYFPINKYIKDENPLNIQSKYLQFLMATIPPTMISLTFTNPLWVIKSIQSQATEPKQTIYGTIKYIYKHNGLVGFQRGLLFGYLNSINGVLTFTMYDILKDLFKANTSFEYATYSAIAKTFAYFISFPIYALRIRQQVNQKSIAWNIKTAIHDPFKSIYFGLSLTLLQMVPKTAILLVLYEMIIKCSR
ncbi:hypothetical protein [Esparto virus]|uniref:Uncharacterized protein n=1 Tax=Esparto virus TaxID=2072209 RepID=A0A2I7G2U5_9VIRU|nr:hypothetical protein [Esparto virus]AUQ43953.1 hypothetical protein [Esparto virus]